MTANTKTRNSILSLQNKGATYHVLLPGFTPEKVCSLIWRAVDKEGNILVSDMGRLSMHVMEQALKTPDARLLGGTKFETHLQHNVDTVYTLDRPERSLQFSMKNLIFNDKQPYLMPVFNGAFFDMKKYLHSILENNA